MTDILEASSSGKEKVAWDRDQLPLHASTVTGRYLQPPLRMGEIGEESLNRLRRSDQTDVPVILLGGLEYQKEVGDAVVRNYLTCSLGQQPGFALCTPNQPRSVREHGMESVLVSMRTAVVWMRLEKSGGARNGVLLSEMTLSALNHALSTVLLKKIPLHQLFAPPVGSYHLSEAISARSISCDIQSGLLHRGPEDAPTVIHQIERRESIALRTVP
ncbi:hypothetical protein KC367_g181 [Hortaea werneckii]|nr:hypothetical protein KC367_g181 [Hortaea werneckii]